MATVRDKDGWKAAAKNDLIRADDVALNATVRVLMREINQLRLRDKQRADDMAAATSLADLKARWAARAELDRFTLADFRQSLNAVIDTIIDGT